MDTLATIKRQRAVMATIADLIVQAGDGKSLRVAVASTHRDEAAFADHLTQALHARGRDCRCQTTRPARAASNDPGSDGVATAVLTVAVITSIMADSDDSEVCRVDIQVNGVGEPGPAGLGGHLDSADPDARAWDAFGVPDIVVDYLRPDGPVIRHLDAALTQPHTG
jgi:hypothetical protein